MTKSLWLKRWSALWSAGFALSVTLFFGSFARRAWRIARQSPAQRREQAESMIRYVGDRLRNHDGVAEFEKFLPEAGIVAYMIYGESLVNLGVAASQDPLKRVQLTKEIEWCLEELSRPRVLDAFPDTQVPDGLFLLARRTLLLAGLHLISPTPSYEQTEEYQDNCAIMTDAFERSRYGLVDSFPGYCLPVDNLAAFRCLRLHDEQYDTEYSLVVEKWKTWARGALDSTYGTLPFLVNSRTGEALAPTSGTIQALSLIELRDVDDEFFRDQYLSFRKHFDNSFLGMRTWREFPEGAEERTDIETGPIVHGHGVMATLVGMSAAKLGGDLRTFSDQMGLLEAIGLPSAKDGMRRYLRGRVLILDALAAYAMSAVPWTKGARDIPELSKPPRPPLLFLAALMVFPLFSMATTAVRYIRIVRKVRPLSLWHSESPSSEGQILFWCQVVAFVSVFFSILWFPVVWAGFGILGRVALFLKRIVKEREAS